MKQRLVLFDFDGTITTKDTLVEFLRFYSGSVKFYLGMLWLSPVVVAYLLKIIPNWKGKQVVLRYFIGGADLTKFNNRCLAFSKTILPGLIRPGALETLREAIKSNATVAVVSASAENWVAPWCHEQRILCIATQLDVVDGKITGKLCGANCYGPEKVNRIKNKFALTEYEEIIAYGDSEGDREMFDIAHKHHYKPFRVQTT